MSDSKKNSIISLQRIKTPLSLQRRNGRVVECTGLENQRTARYRGFESLFLRSLDLS